LKIFTSIIIVLILTVTLSFSSFARKSSNYFVKKYYYSVSLYKKLKTKKVKNKRRFSTKVIQNFYYIYNSSSSRKLKAKSLFLIGRTYYFLAEYYQSEVFTDLSIGSFYRLTKEFRKSSLCDDAKYFSAKLFYYYKNLPTLAVEQLNDILTKYPRGDYRKRAKRFLLLIKKKNPSIFKKKKKRKHISIPKNYAVINKIRTFGLKNFSRIVLDLKGKPKFKISKNSLQRTVTIKIFKAVTGKNFKIVSLNNNSVDEKLTIRKKKNYILITFNSWKIKSLNYFTLTNPQRIVIDIEENKAGRFLVPHETISTIIIDPGHGGKDPGARYFGLNEKDVALKISKYVKYYLQKILKSGKYNILITRDSDIFLSLEDRATFANENNADLFVSIHCNASPDHRIYGLETYYLDIDKHNPFIKKVNGEVNTILEDLIRNSKLEESIELATYIQKSMIYNLRRRYSHIHNLGIKEAPFYVLFGTRMPSVLVETSFISNRRENRRLRNNSYIKLLAKSIAKGIASYIKSQRFVR